MMQKKISCTSNKMEERAAIVKQMTIDYPNLGHLLIESMVIAYEQGKLDEIMEGIDFSQKEPKRTELPGSLTIENKNVAIK